MELTDLEARLTTIETNVGQALEVSAGARKSVRSLSDALQESETELKRRIVKVEQDYNEGMRRELSMQEELRSVSTQTRLIHERIDTVLKNQGSRDLKLLITMFGVLGTLSIAVYNLGVGQTWWT